MGDFLCNVSHRNDDTLKIKCFECGNIQVEIKASGNAGTEFSTPPVATGIFAYDVRQSL